MTEDDHRSVSQAREIQECPYAYYLRRRAQVWRRPAAWLPQGIAFHAAVEEWEKSGRVMSLKDTQQAYVDRYVDETNKLCEETPNFDHWSASGPYHAEADIERRYNSGLEQVARYIEYYLYDHPAEVLWVTPGGDPAAELGFDITLDGVKVQGCIDAIIHHPVFGLIVRDNKTGRLPGDELQLATYAVGVNDRYGLGIKSGDYWMARAGAPTTIYRLDRWTRGALCSLYGWVDEEIRSERWTPKPEPEKCRMCDVSSACEFNAAR